MFTGAVLVSGCPLPLPLCGRRSGLSRRGGGEGCESSGGGRCRGRAGSDGHRAAPRAPFSVLRVRYCPFAPPRFPRPRPPEARARRRRGLGVRSLLGVSSPASAGAHVPVRSSDTGATLPRRGPGLCVKGAAEPRWRSGRNPALSG